MYSDPVIPNHNRAFLTDQRLGMGEAAYIDWIWNMRDWERRGMLPEDQTRTISRGGWPGDGKPPVVVQLQVQK